MTAIYERGATLDDAVRLAGGFQSASVWKDVSLDADAISRFLAAISDMESGYLLISPTGGIGGLITPLWFAPTFQVAQELFWYSEDPGEGQRLRRAFEAWAIARGAGSINFSCMLTEREPALRRMYARNGFEPVEIAFRKAV